MPMRLLLSLLFVLFLAPATQAQKIKTKKVPYDLLVVFRDTYPAATKAKWRKQEGNYRVDFEHLGRQRRVVYGKDLRWISKESTVTEAELPLATVVTLKEEYGSCVLKQLRSLETQEQFTLEAVLACPDKKTQTLRFDRNGRLQTAK